MFLCFVSDIMFEEKNFIYEARTEQKYDIILTDWDVNHFELS